MRVTVWNENYHERHDQHVAALYPHGIHGAIASGLVAAGLSDVRTATQDEPSHGLSHDVLAATDVLVWWGHMEQDKVSESVVDAVVSRVHEGMGLVVLHSALGSKVFKRLMGTTCAIDAWRHGGQELVWHAAPAHPIAAGVPHPIAIPEGEMYSEPFDIPTPENVVFITSYEGGEVLRSGMTFRRGLGRIFYFAPGHEESPIYFHPDVRLVLANAVRWAAPAPPVGTPAVLPRSLNREPGWFRREGAEQ